MQQFCNACLLAVVLGGSTFGCRIKQKRNKYEKAPMSDAQKEDILRQFPAAELVAL